jgi:Transcriptional regulator
MTKQREKVKEVAVCMVKGEGLINLSRRELCERAGIPDGSFPHIMGCNFSEFVEELKLEGIKEISHSVSKTRANPGLRKDHILNVAVTMARVYGYSKLTRDKVAESAGVSVGLVTRYFGTMNQLKTAVMRRAIKQGMADIIAQGLANGDDHAKKAPAELKAEAVTILSNY